MAESSQRSIYSFFSRCNSDKQTSLTLTESSSETGECSQDGSVLGADQSGSETDDEDSELPMSKRPCSATTLTAGHHRMSGFDRSWQRAHPWIFFNRDEKSMYCRLCTRFNKKPRNGTGTWVTKGCTSFRYDKIKSHEQSSSHKEAERERAYLATSEETGGIRAALQEVISQERRAIIGALKCMYFLAKNEIPHTTTFSGLLDLAINLGSDYLRVLRQAGNAHYRSEQIMSEFIQCISKCVQEDITNALHQSESISLMVDESTDVSITKQLVIYGRCVVDGELKCHFLGIRDLFNGTADVIETSLLEFLQEVNLDVNSVSSFGSDGASVMTGRRTGVATRLQRNNNGIIAIHCVAHRLALAAAQASQSIPYLARFKEILSSLFYFYHNSAVRQSGLSEIQKILGDPVLRLKQAKDVRWLSHQAAVDSLRRTLVAVVTSLDREAAERSEPTASGLKNFILKYFFVASLSLFADVLPHIGKLSRIMQNSALDFSILQAVIDSCIRSVEKQKDNPGHYISDLDHLIQVLDEAGHHIEVNDTMRSCFDSQVKIPYLCALVKNLRDRFPSVEVISAFHIFDPRQLPADEADLHQYGVQELDCLLKHYSSSPLELAEHETREEWKQFKTFLSTSNDLKRSSVKDLAKFLLCTPERRQLFPLLSKLLVRGIVLPVATADCERAFSAMNRIKTVPRNRLKTTTLQQLMFISIEGPSSENFDFSRAADKWGTLHNRRIHWQT